MFSERPWFGWGYLSYNGSDVAGNVAVTFEEFQNYDVPHFHNSYLQVMVDCGIIFFSIFIMSLIYLLAKLYSLSVIDGNKSCRSALVIFFVVLVASLFVNVFLKYNDMPMMLLMIFLGYFTFGRIDLQQKECK